MQKIFKKTIILLFFLILACTETVDNVKKGLGGGKRNTTDEFLVKKKDPLTMPPKWGDLPVPGSSGAHSITKNQEDGEEVSDIEDLIQLGAKEKKAKSNEGSKNLEESFLKKIKQK